MCGAVGEGGPAVLVPEVGRETELHPGAEALHQREGYGILQGHELSRVIRQDIALLGTIRLLTLVGHRRSTKDCTPERILGMGEEASTLLVVVRREGEGSDRDEVGGV